MKRIVYRAALPTAATFVLLCAAATPLFAADREFTDVVANISQRYDIKADHIPLLGFIGFCAWAGSAGAVAHLHIADFENINRSISADDLDALLRSQLGNSWHQFIRSHERDSHEDTLIYARPDGSSFRLLIVDLESSELSLVELKLGARAMRSWTGDPEGHVQHHYRRDID